MPREKPAGKATVAVVVEAARVPDRAGQVTIMSEPWSEVICSVTAVPTGMLEAWITIGTELEVLMEASGVTKLPVGEAGRLTPFTEIALMVPPEVVGR